MQVSQTKHSVEVSRKPGAKRARTEAHFWGMVRDAMNDDSYGHKQCWELTRPHKYSLTSMPFALHRGRNKEEMVTDNDYATRDVRALYNKGETVTLSRLYFSTR
jgi:hypothetical protein